MGHRVELGEIEAGVNQLPGIRMAACIYDADKRRIVLFIVGETSEKDLLPELKRRLPRYMLPGRRTSSIFWRRP